MRQSDDFMDFTNKYGHSEDAKISDVLWLCTTLFTTASKVVKSRSIIWFTNDDSPHQSGHAQLQQAFQKAKDIQQLQIDVKFCPMSTSFDGDKFYKELICQIMNFNVNDFEFPEPLLDERPLVNRISSRSYKKRALAYLEFEISNTSKFGVGVYSNTGKDKAQLKSHIFSRKDNKEIKKRRFVRYGYRPQTNGSDDEDAEFEFTENLDPTKTVKYRVIGNDCVKFSITEAFGIKQVMNPKIKLLAFKSKDFLNESFYYIKSPQFLYPHDGKIKNSSKLFRALWEQMIKEDKVGICAYTMRLKSSPRIVALVPSQQTLQDDEIIRYDGFQMIFLPFADDIRDLSKFMDAETIDSEENDEQIENLMMKIIGKLKVKYTPLMFENMQNHRIITLVENQVYDEDLDEETMNSFKLPNVAAQDQRIGKYVDEVEELIDGFAEVKVTKRKKNDKDENANNEKRAKVAPDDINVELILEKCQKGDVKSITNQMLRDYLSLKQVSGISKMNKADLVSKIISLA